MVNFQTFRLGFEAGKGDRERKGRTERGKEGQREEREIERGREGQREKREGGGNCFPVQN